MCISYAIGAISIFPVPRYTLTNPSPETADPSKLLLDFSTLKSNELDQAIAKFPSILTSSFSSTNSISSSLGTGLSNTAIPSPLRHKLNNPSFPKHC